MTGIDPHLSDDAPTSRGPLLNRRRLLGAGIAVAAVAAGGTGTAFAGSAPAAATEVRAPRRGVDFLDAAMDAYLDKGPIRLIQSYTDQGGLFSAAFTYDSAIAILAYLADGRAQSHKRAIVLGDALLFAQANDPEFTDGRLRQGYNAGPYTFYDGVLQPDGLVRADGKANICSQFGFVGTAVGDMAWAGIALVALYRRTKAWRFRAAAVKIGEWIEANARTDEPLGGYKFGLTAAQAKHPGTATEHNIDLIALFGQLDAITGNHVWKARRNRAEAFVAKMWEPEGRFFYTGTNDGVTINKDIIPEDTQTWGYLAYRTRAYQNALDWEAANLAVSDNAERKNSTVPAGQTYDGVTFTTKSKLANEDAPIAEWQPKPDRNGVWFEGSAHLALALRTRGKSGDEGKARALLASIERAQDLLGTGQTHGGKALPERAGVVSASSPLDTGFGFGYYPYRHVGATAWYVLAAHRSNPLAV